jgi:hypothetical protein
MDVTPHGAVHVLAPVVVNVTFVCAIPVKKARQENKNKTVFNGTSGKNVLLIIVAFNSRMKLY